MFIGIARVIKPVGVKGALRIKYLADNTEGLAKYQQIWAFSHRTGELIPLTLVFEDRQLERVLFEKFDCPELACRLNGFYLGVSSALIPDDPQQPPLLFRLIGMEVYLNTGEKVGKVIEVIELPVHPVLNIRCPSGQEFMVPYVPPIVIDIDRAQRKVTLDSSRVRVPD